MGYYILKNSVSGIFPPFTDGEAVRKVPIGPGFQFPYLGSSLMADGRVWLETFKPQFLSFFNDELNRESWYANLGASISLKVFEACPVINLYTHCEKLGEDHAHTFLYRKRGDTRIYYWSTENGLRFSVDYDIEERQWYGYFPIDLFPFESFVNCQLVGFDFLTLEHKTFNHSQFLAKVDNNLELVTNCRNLSVRTPRSFYRLGQDINEQGEFCKLFSLEGTHVLVVENQVAGFSRTFVSRYVQESEYIYGRFWSELFYRTIPNDRVQKATKKAVEIQLQHLKSWKVFKIKFQRPLSYTVGRIFSAVLAFPFRIAWNNFYWTVFFLYMTIFYLVAQYSESGR